LSAISLSLVGASIQDSWAEPVAVVGFTFAGVMILVLVSGVWRSFARVNRVVKTLGSSPIHYRLDETCLRVTDSVGAIELPWASFVELQELPRRLVLKVHSGGAVMIFSDDVPEDALMWIRERVPVAQVERDSDDDPWER
jgi:hypothetical protein